MSEARRERKLSPRKKLLTVATVFGVLLGAYVWIAFTDISPIDDSDLVLSHPQVAKEENAYTWMVRAWEAEGRAGSADALEFTLRAAECSVLFPPPARLGSTKLFMPVGFREEFREAVWRGDLDAAWQIFGAIRRVTRLHSEYPGLLTTMSFLRQCTHQTSWAIGLATRDPSRERLHHWLRTLETPLLHSDWEARMHMRHYEWFRDGLIAEEGRFIELPHWQLRPNRTAARLADITRGRIRGEELPRQLDGPPSLSTRVAWWLGGNVSGESYAWSFAALPDRIAEMLAEQSLSRDSLLRTTLAIRVFSLEHGRYPEQLSELVPQLLPAVPLDPFDPAESEMRWDSSRRVLWSIGGDGIDDGGVANARGGRGSAAVSSPQNPADLTVVFPENPFEKEERFGPSENSIPSWPSKQRSPR